MNDNRHYGSSFVFTNRSAADVIYIEAGPGELLNINGAVKFNGTDNSTGITTGSFVVAGGAGIGGDWNSGGSVTVLGTITADSGTVGNLLASSINASSLSGLSSSLNTNNSTISSSFNAGSLSVSVMTSSSLVTSAGSLTTQHLIAPSATLDVSNYFQCDNLTNNGSSVIGKGTTGSLLCVSSTATFLFGSIEWKCTENATSTSTGSVEMDGGIGALKNLCTPGSVSIDGFFLPSSTFPQINAGATIICNQMSLSNTSRHYHSFASSYATPSGYYTFDNFDGEIHFLQSGSYLLTVDYLSQVETSFQTINCGIQANGTTDLTPTAFADLIIGYNIMDHKLHCVLKVNLNLGSYYIRLWTYTTNATATGTYQNATIAVTKIADSYL